MKKGSSIKIFHTLFRKLAKHKVISVLGGLLLATIIVLVVMPAPEYKEGFRNLHELQEYAKTIDEWEKMDNDNILNPSYESYYAEKFNRSFVTKIKKKISYFVQCLFCKQSYHLSIASFEKLLNEVTKYRIAQKWTGNIVQKIEISPSSKIIVFGVLEGSFHSLLRDLDKLKELNIIDEKLNLTNPAYFIVFLGNVIDRSPYSLEIFSVMLQLLKQNPQNVFYVKGRHESNNLWKQHTLGRELELSYINSAKIQPLVEQFFNTIPLSVYCTLKNNLNHPVLYFKFSSLIEDEKIRQMLDDSHFVYFFHRPYKSKVEMLNLDNPSHNNSTQDPSTIKLLAIVTEIKKRDSYEVMDGLRLLPPIHQVTAWTVLSGSSEPVRRGLNFFYDAIVIINPSTDIDQWTITLYNRDIRNKEEINFKTRSQYFFSGTEI